jgi:tetratricopeptide (TPR) repeat protein
MRRHLCGLYATCLAIMAGSVSLAAEPGDLTKTVIGEENELLARGAEALEAGHAEQGVALTLAGLERPGLAHETAAAHSNLCAGYAMLKRWDEALAQCNLAIGLDPGNWRSYNNRAAVYVSRGEYQLAIADVNSGLELAPQSALLRKSLEIVRQHQRAARERRRGAVNA